jgi:hypothetical protein
MALKRQEAGRGLSEEYPYKCTCGISTRDVPALKRHITYAKKNNAPGQHAPSAEYEKEVRIKSSSRPLPKGQAAAAAILASLSKFRRSKKRSIRRSIRRKRSSRR